MDILSEREVLRTEFNKLADKHNILLTENLKLQSQLEFKDTFLDYIKTIHRPVDIPKSIKPQMIFTIVKRASKTHAN